MGGYSNTEKGLDLHTGMVSITAIPLSLLSAVVVLDASLEVRGSVVYTILVRNPFAVGPSWLIDDSEVLALSKTRRLRGRR